jgi:hypothetical protein
MVFDNASLLAGIIFAIGIFFCEEKFFEENLPSCYTIPKAYFSYIRRGR